MRGSEFKCSMLRFFLYRYIKPVPRITGKHTCKSESVSQSKTFVWEVRYICLQISIKMTPAGSLSSSVESSKALGSWDGAVPCLANHVSGWDPVLCTMWSPRLSTQYRRHKNTACRLSRRMALFTHTVWNLKYPLLSLDWVFILEHGPCKIKLPL